jgi:DNA-directed RNA polymerase specialized sigma24 family protein
MRPPAFTCVSDSEGSLPSTPQTQLEMGEVRILLEKAIADLPHIDREAFVLRDVRECSVKHSAERPGVTASVVKVKRRFI